MQRIRQIYRRAKAVGYRYRWVSFWSTVVGLLYTYLGTQSAVVWAVLMAWLVSSGAYAWAATLGAALAAWALAAGAQWLIARKNYLISITQPTPVALPEAAPPEPIRFSPKYSPDEIRSELLPALAQLDQIMERRCLRAVAIWQTLENAYWDKPNGLHSLRGDEAIRAVGQLEKSRNLISSAHAELYEAVKGDYAQALAPLIEIKGSILRDADMDLRSMAARLREFEKHSADDFDRGPFFRDDGLKIRGLQMEYGGWAQERRLAIQSQMVAYRDFLQTTTLGATQNGERQIPKS